MLTRSPIDSMLRYHLTATRKPLYALLSVLIGCACSSSSKAIGDAKDDDGDESEPSLYQRYAPYFPIGAAVDSSSFQDDHVPLLKKHFNSIVCENEMKWESLQPTEGVFNYTTADQMVAFAESNGMMVRGHTLVWHNQTPAWVFVDAANAPVSRAVLLQRMREHITNVMTHFRGKVLVWDVINEAITGNTEAGADAGEDLSQVVSWGYRNSDWYKIAGEDYIVEAFRAARAADPNAKLFYNDYWNYLDDKRQAIIAMIEKLRAENLIDGVGLQCHLNIEPAQEKLSNQTVFQTVGNLDKEIRTYASLGLEVQVTELDISMYTRDYGSSDETKWYRTEADLTESLKGKQAARYKEFFDMFRQNSDSITNVTFWGIADDNTWLSEFTSGRPDYPLLFDKQLKPKKAFYSVADF